MGKMQCSKCGKVLDSFVMSYILDGRLVHFCHECHKDFLDKVDEFEKNIAKECKYL